MVAIIFLITRPHLKDVWPVLSSSSSSLMTFVLPVPSACSQKSLPLCVLCSLADSANCDLNHNYFFSDIFPDAN